MKVVVSFNKWPPDVKETGHRTPPASASAAPGKSAPRRDAAPDLRQSGDHSFWLVSLVDHETRRSTQGHACLTETTIKATYACDMAKSLLVPGEGRPMNTFHGHEPVSGTYKMDFRRRMSVYRGCPASKPHGFGSPEKEKMRPGGFPWLPCHPTWLVSRWLPDKPHEFSQLLTTRYKKWSTILVFGSHQNKKLEKETRSH